MTRNIFNVDVSRFKEDQNDLIKLQNDLKELQSDIQKASDNYYNTGTSELTDKQFDEKLKELSELEDRLHVEDKVSTKVGAPVPDGLPKFAHTYPALSLDKTKDIDEFVSKFQKGILESGSSNDKVVLMWKEDGSTLQAYYHGGKLDKLVTRGNGEIGSIITHNASCIKGLPLQIPYEGDVVVRGEALISYSDFESINSEIDDIDLKYKNPRNLAAASTTLLNPAETAQRCLHMKAFNLVHIDSLVIDRFSERLDFLSSIGFDVVEHVTVSVNELKHEMERMTSSVSNYPYPVDGLVAALDNCEYASKQEGTEHHLHILNGYAFKWADETKETILREIEWSPSRTGLLNPVAIFDPIELEGTTVQRASLHNLSIVRKMKIKIGDRLAVCKSNMIIPFVDKNLDYDNHEGYADEEAHQLIGCCPTCGCKAEINKSADGIETAYCPNPDCLEKLVGKLTHFCSRDCMDVQGMSSEVIRKLVNNLFISEYKDFFKIKDNPEIGLIEGFGEISWKNFCSAIEKARTTDFVRFITALSIPNIGKGQAKILCKYLSNNYDMLCNKVTGMSTDEYDLVKLLARLAEIDFDFSIIDGFGTIMADGLLKWLKEHLSPSEDSPEKRVYFELIFTDKRPDSNLVSSAISGKSFCITGKLFKFNNRQALVDKIESQGGKWVDSVSSKTDFLINNDVTSSSSKNKKAHELNIPIITEEEFLRMVE